MNELGGKVSGLFPDSKVVVVGIPPNFKIVEELERANSIRLAMAFCHMTGWTKLESGIRKCKGSVRLITGLDFFQTEPALLRTWNRLSVDHRFRPRLMTSGSGIFHPKVLIVSSSRKNFALVGSGNLSEGGLRTNIECFVYTADETQVGNLAEWFDGLFKNAQEFGEDDIRAYEPKYKSVHRAVSKIHRQQRSLEAALTLRNKAFLGRWQQAVDQAKQEFQKPEFKNQWRKRKEAVERMKQFLHYPLFDFSSKEWSAFYSVRDLGHLIPIYRDRVFRQEKRLKEALHLLVDEKTPIEKRLSAVLDSKGSHHIVGLRMNTVSKILALHDGSKWPVFNSPVDTTLRFFGYKAPRGVDMAGKYLAFANLMQDFMKECKARDVYALDSFFYWFAERMKRPSVHKNVFTEQTASRPARLPQRLRLPKGKKFFTNEEVSPIFADVIKAYGERNKDLMTHEKIVAAFMEHPVGQLILNRPHAMSNRYWVGVMLAWFSRIITDGRSAWESSFKREKIGSAWAYGVRRSRTSPS